MQIAATPLHYCRESAWEIPTRQKQRWIPMQHAETYPQVSHIFCADIHWTLKKLTEMAFVRILRARSQPSPLHCPLVTLILQFLRYFPSDIYYLFLSPLSSSPPPPPPPLFIPCYKNIESVKNLVAKGIIGFLQIQCLHLFEFKLILLYCVLSF